MLDPLQEVVSNFRSGASGGHRNCGCSELDLNCFRVPISICVFVYRMLPADSRQH